MLYAAYWHNIGVTTSTGNVAAIVGGVGGGLLVVALIVLVLIVLLVIIIKKRKSGKSLIEDCFAIVNISFNIIMQIVNFQAMNFQQPQLVQYTRKLV